MPFESMPSVTDSLGLLGAPPVFKARFDYWQYGKRASHVVVDFSKLDEAAKKRKHTMLFGFKNS